MQTSSTELWTQVNGVHNKIREFIDRAPDGVNLACYSQGVLKLANSFNYLLTHACVIFNCTVIYINIMFLHSYIIIFGLVLCARR